LLFAALLSRSGVCEMQWGAFRDLAAGDTSKLAAYSGIFTSQMKGDERFFVILNRLVFEMTFGGFALSAFVAFAYLPQIACVASVFAVFIAPMLFGMVVLWIKTSWLFGLSSMIASSVLLLLSGACKFQWRLFHTFAAEDSAKLAAYSGILTFPIQDDGRDVVTRMLLVVLNRVVFENLLQLWIQSSYFSFSFELMNHEARIKAIMSIGLGLAVCMSKLIPLLLAFLSTEVGRPDAFMCRDGPQLFVFAWAVLLAWIFCLLVVLWVAAKVYFAFQCPSHIWNVICGCIVFSS
jgi:hypothetical protein